MKREQEVLLTKATKGMVLSRDVEVDDYLLVVRNTVLNPKLISLLKKHSINSIWVWVKDETELFAETFKENYQKFETLTEAMVKGEPVNKADVEEIVDNYLGMSSKYELLRFTNGIREVDQYTYEHCLSVCYLAIMLGQWLKFSNLHSLAEAALLHDMGKMKIKNEILNKPGKLTSAEWEHMKMHPLLGYEFLKANSDLSDEVLEGILHHHENRDGSGYPAGLASSEIPVISKIITIADVFDALTSDRVYRKKMDVIEALELMSSQYQKFEPEFLNVFCENMLDKLVGEEVILSNGNIGQIVYKNPTDNFSLLVKTADNFVNVGRDSGVKVAMVI